MAITVPTEAVLQVALVGTEAGAVVPSSAVSAAGGDVQFVLGSDSPGIYTSVSKSTPLARAKVEQTGTLDNVSFVRVRATIVGRSDAPAGTEWAFRTTNDNAVDRTFFVEPERTRAIVDVVHPESLLSGGVMGFELVLLGTPIDNGAIAELPAVVVEFVVDDTSPTGAIDTVNRDPAPDGNNWSVERPIGFDLEVVSSPNETPLLSATNISVEDEAVMTAGVFQGTWATNSTATAGTSRYRFELKDTTPLDDDRAYVVRVETQSTSFPAPQIFEWTFTTQDMTGPLVDQVQAIALDVVRIRFAEAVTAVSSSTAGDALNPSSYAIELDQSSAQTRLPAVLETTVASVRQIDALTFDLSLTQELTPSALYTLTTSAEDLAENPALALSYSVTGFVPFVDGKRDYDYLRWLPRAVQTVDETFDYRNFIRSLQEVGELLLYEADQFVDRVLDPDTAEEAYIDAMLVDLGNPFGFFTLNLTQKRKLVQLLPSVYKQKGTDVGIINAIRFFLGIEVTIEALNSNGVRLGVTSILGDNGTNGTFRLAPSLQGTIYTFVIRSPVVLTDEQRAQITGIANYMKRAVTRFLIVEPQVPAALTGVWQVGTSRLGVDTVLGE